MIALLGFVLDGIELIGSYVLWALETFINAVGAALVAALGALFALLPSMSPTSDVGQPQWLQWLNWFYPVGDLLAGLAVIVTMYGTWLVVRWGLRLIRAA